MSIHRISIIINLALLTAIAYLSVTLLYGIMDSQMAYTAKENAMTEMPVAHAALEPQPLAYYNPIMQRDLFLTKIDPKSKGPENTLNIDTLEETLLKLKLWGTVSGSAESAYAVIEDTKKREQNLYRVGDVIQEATLKAIFRERVVLDVNGKDEILSMEKIQQTAAASRTSARQSDMGRSFDSENTTPTVRTQRVSLNRSTIESAMEDVSKLMTEITITPHIAEDGQQSGLALKNIKPTSIFRRMGLRNGDILVGVDGQEIESVDDALGLYENLKTASKVQVQLLRRGQQRTLEYNIQ